jgi:8-oxo-dGTP pyrophosphatase MutT (NUDIX family)
MVPNTNHTLQPQYMMVQRKDSLSYGTFMRGKYSISMRPYLLQLFNNMTSSERSGLQHYTFDTLWKQLWQVDTCNSHMKEYEDARSKFDMLLKGYYIRAASPPNQRNTDPDTSKNENLTFVSLATLLNDTHPPIDDETEWGFPKGRRNINEDDLSCAIREFSEETAVTPGHLRVVHPCKPFEEVFTGGNGIRYRHVYYLASINDPVLCNPFVVRLEPGSRMQKREVRSVQWFNYDDAIAKMRPQNVERRELFKRIHSIVQRSML